MGPKLEGDLPYVIFLDLATLHARRNRVRNPVQRRGPASTKVIGKTSGIRPRSREQVIKELRASERIVQVIVHH
jgi:hypothetical protein